MTEVGVFHCVVYEYRKCAEIRRRYAKAADKVQQPHRRRGDQFPNTLSRKYQFNYSRPTREGNRTRMMSVRQD